MTHFSVLPAEFRVARAGGCPCQTVMHEAQQPLLALQQHRRLGRGQEEVRGQTRGQGRRPEKRRDDEAYLVRRQSEVL